mgnify:FL=1
MAASYRQREYKEANKCLSSIIKRTGELFSFSDDEQGTLAKLAIQRNRLAHRYLNFRWQVMKFYSDNKTLIQRLVSLILEMEVKKQEGNS